MKKSGIVVNYGNSKNQSTEPEVLRDSGVLFISELAQVILGLAIIGILSNDLPISRFGFWFSILAVFQLLMIADFGFSTVVARLVPDPDVEDRSLIKSVRKSQLIIVPVAHINPILSENGDFEHRIKNIGLEVNRNFWDSDPCILFGNDSARRHLHNPNSKEFNEIQGRRKKDVKSSGPLDHREITLSQSSITSENIIQKSNRVYQISNFLESNDSIIQSKSKITYPSKGPSRCQQGPFSHNNISCGV